VENAPKTGGDDSDRATAQRTYHGRWHFHRRTALQRGPFQVAYEVAYREASPQHQRQDKAS